MFDLRQPQQPSLSPQPAYPQQGGLNINIGGASGGISSLAESPVMGYADGGLLSGPAEKASITPGDADQVLIIEAARAIIGENEQPEQAIRNFLVRFGGEALNDLRSRVENGDLDAILAAYVPPQQPDGFSQSDGLSDSIPARTDAGQEVALSEGEYVVPADVVSGLGNGSTEAGARQLEDMVGRTRMARGGIVGTPPPVNPQGVLPR
jgi:hypothetical protein